MLVLDAAGRVALVNRALYRLLGRSAGRTSLEPVHPLAYGALGVPLGKTAVAGVQAVLAGRSPHYEATCEVELGAERRTLNLHVTRLEPTGGATSTSTPAPTSTR